MFSSGKVKLVTALVDRLKKHVAKIRAGDNTDSTVHRLLALLRELLEERKERDKYPLLTMFCDWTLHTGLDRSKAGSGVLDTLDETWAWSQRVDEQIQGLLRDISPQKLREQMISLLTSEFIDPSILDDVASCRLIIDYLIRDLQG